MSGSIGLSGLPFNDAEKVDIRRFCGYPAYGVNVTGFQSWRFFQAYGELEYRLNNFSPYELQVVRQYLATLYTLEQAVPTASDNLDTDKAAVWTHNKAEVVDRMRLYRTWRLQLCSIMGVPPGEAISTGGGVCVV